MEYSATKISLSRATSPVDQTGHDSSKQPECHSESLCSRQPWITGADATFWVKKIKQKIPNSVEVWNAVTLCTWARGYTGAEQ